MSVIAPPGDVFVTRAFIASEGGTTDERDAWMGYRWWWCGMTMMINNK